MCNMCGDVYFKHQVIIVTLSGWDTHCVGIDLGLAQGQVVVGWAFLQGKGVQTLTGNVVLVLVAFMVEINFG